MYVCIYNTVYICTVLSFQHFLRSRLSALAMNVLSASSSSPSSSSSPPCPVNERVGHVAAAASSADGDGLVIVWGGYREARKQQPPGQHVYWPPDRVQVFDPRSARWEDKQTRGKPPSRTSGATGCVLDGQVNT